jgi:hypothetical protein
MYQPRNNQQAGLNSPIPAPHQPEAEDSGSATKASDTKPKRSGTHIFVLLLEESRFYRDNEEITSTYSNV